MNFFVYKENGMKLIMTLINDNNNDACAKGHGDDGLGVKVWWWNVGTIWEKVRENGNKNKIF